MAEYLSHPDCDLCFMLINPGSSTSGILKIQKATQHWRFDGESGGALPVSARLLVVVYIRHLAWLLSALQAHFFIVCRLFDAASGRPGEQGGLRPEREFFHE